MLNKLPSPSFNGFLAIIAHIQQRTTLDNYINGKSKAPPDSDATNCNTNCRFAKWAHHHGFKGFKDIGLLNQICDTCGTFHSTSAQAMLLKNMGKERQAKEILRDGGIWDETSAKFQRKLTRLHYQLAAGSHECSSAVERRHQQAANCAQACEKLAA